jgi:hypothetical protein
VKAFLKAGVLSEDGAERDTITGTPKGGSSHRCSATSRSRPSTSTSPGRGRRWGHRVLASGADARGWPTTGWCGTRTTLSSWWPAAARMPRACAQVAAILAEMGLRLSEAKTRVVHIDEGLEFLGFRIQRHPRRGTTRRHIYTYPSKAAVAAVKTKVRAATRQGTNQPLAALLRRLNPVLRGWANYFWHGCPRQPSTTARLRLAPGRFLTSPQAPSDVLGAATPTLPACMVAGTGRDDAPRSDAGARHPVPLAGRPHPLAVALERADTRDSCVAQRHQHVESPLRGNAHGGASRGNGPAQGRHRAPARPYDLLRSGATAAVLGHRVMAPPPWGPSCAPSPSGTSASSTGSPSSYSCARGRPVRAPVMGR